MYSHTEGRAAIEIFPAYYNQREIYARFNSIGG